MNIQPCIRTEGLIYRYEPGYPALNGIDLEIPEHAYLGIIGQNGSGKTTLVKHFNGLLKPTAGEVWVYGRATSSRPVSELARTVGYVFQNPDHQIFGATTREEISFGPRNLGLSEAEVEERTEEALAAFDLEAYAELPPAVLGFGLRRKVSVAAVYAMRPPILILDEPTSGLDWRSARELMALVDRLHAQGHTIILISHDMRLIAQHTQQTLVLQEGRVLLYGSTREVFQQHEVLQQAQITPPQINQLASRLADCGLPQDVLTVAEFCQAYNRLKEARE
ncbi:MAG: ATP-binding cassette domain-containing protein [Anaerolineae bacterium]|nr:ATP-binding cassette domain-containing protein [Anaerolineae bacterium]